MIAFDRFYILTADLLDRLARASLCKPIHITSGVSFLRLEVSAIGSLTTTRTTPTRPATTVAISANEKLLRALSAVETLKAPLPIKGSNVFAKVVQPLRPMQQSLRQHAFVPDLGTAMALPSEAQVSSVGGAVFHLHDGTIVWREDMSRMVWRADDLPKKR